MSDTNQKQLGNTLWAIADQLHGAMDADDFRDYMLSFLFLRYLSDNYETAAKKELGRDYPDVGGDARKVPLALWYANNVDDIPDFEKQMRRKVHYVIQPVHLWNSIANMARTQNTDLLTTLLAGFKYIETESFESTFQGLFSEIDLSSPKLGKTYPDRNAKLCTIIQKIAEGLAQFFTDIDALGDAYEYLIGQFSAGSGRKAGEFYTPQQISEILSAIVTLDSQEPKTGTKKRLESVMDFSCSSGSLLLNVRKKVNKAGGTIGKLYGQEKNITTYNLARMNMLLHGVKDTEFEIFHGDTLLNEWDMMREQNPARKPSFDAVVAKVLFQNKMQSKAPAYLGFIARNFDDKDVDTLIEHFRDPERRKEFFKEYKEIEMLYEIISPDAFLRPFINDYSTLSAIYQVVRKAYTKTVMVDRDFQAKTNQLVQSTVGSYGVGHLNEILEINGNTIELINKMNHGDGTKVINLIKSIEKVAEESSDDPYLIAMGERAKAVQESFESRQTSTAEALEELLREVADNEARKKVQAEKSFDGLTYFVYRTLLDVKIENAEAVSRKIRDAFTDFPNWRRSENAMRELRKKVTFAIFAETEDLNVVSALVDDLFSLLEKANRI